MTYQGHVENGVVVLDASVTLPEGAKVEVAVVDTPADSSRRKPIWEVIVERANSIPEEDLRELPTDGSINLDHYLYGAPKCEP